MRVHARITEIGFEPGAAVVARLLVHSQQIGCLLGRGELLVLAYVYFQRNNLQGVVPQMMKLFR